MRIAYTAVITAKGEYRLGIAKEGESGYYVTKDGTSAGGTFESWGAAQSAAHAFNVRLGISPEAALTLVLGTMPR